jgi:deoxycytidylate deaminase
VLNSVGGDANVGVVVVRQYRISAVGIAGTPREVAAGHVELDPVAGAKSVTDVAEIDC